MKTKTKSNRPEPCCVFCGRHGNDVQFAIFNPRFKPFGTACVNCEESLPPGTVVPQTPAPPNPPVEPVTESQSECEFVFAVPGSSSIIDVVRGSTGLSWINGETLEQIQQRDPRHADAVKMASMIGLKPKPSGRTHRWRGTKRRKKTIGTCWKCCRQRHKRKARSW